MRILFTLTLITMMSGCPSPADTDTDVDTDSDTDACPGAIGQQEFIDRVLQDQCEYYLTCDDNRWESVDACVLAFTRYFNGQPCWDECNAAECQAFVEDPPTCTVAAEVVPVACEEVKTCPD